MSYLHTPRLIFSGDFQADVTTVNNDVRRYDNSTFEPRFQEPRQDDCNLENGSWNPLGGNTFRFVDCRVTGGVYEDSSGTIVNDDTVIGHLITGPSDQSNGKIVDLDPQMQMASQLWAVTLRLCTADNEFILQGDIEPTTVRDVQIRQRIPPGINNQPVGGAWTSVLKNVEWTTNSQLINNSQILSELFEASNDKPCLALNLTAFGYYRTHEDGRFSMGRLLGTIAPYFECEPELFAPARRLLGTKRQGLILTPTPPGPQALSHWDYSNFLFEEDKNRLTIDLGNSIPIADPLGTLVNLERIRVAVAKIEEVPISPDPAIKTTIAASDREIIGEVNHSINWLNDTAGIVSFSVAGDAATLLRDHQLLLLADPDSSGNDVVLACESTNGLVVRVNNHVLRMDPRDPPATVEFYAYQWGRPLPNGTISLDLAPSVQANGTPLGPDDKPPQAEVPYDNTPSEVLHFAPELTTNEQGRQTLEIRGEDPRNPRDYIEGQSYQINYRLDGLPFQQQHILDQIMIHLRDGHDVPDTPTWADVEPTLTQYANLYPLMSKHIVDLGNEEEVLKRKEILLYSFTRDINDPDYMPVSRDLSAAKLQTIVKWLQNSGTNAAGSS